jgi:non-heme chloroperoxidase
MDRRSLLQAVAGAGALAGVPAAAAPATAAPAKRPRRIEASDGATLFYRDWGTGPVIVFCHSLAVDSDMWTYQTAAFADRYRCVTYDRRGHGRSDQPDGGYDYDTLADDLAAVIEQLDLKDVTLVGHSMGAGEVVRYLTRHGSRRVKRIVLAGATTPFLMKTDTNPSGIDPAAFEALRGMFRQDFPKWVADNTPSFFVPTTSPEMMQWGARAMMQTQVRVLIACNHAVTETDFRRELTQIKVPTLIIHGDKDASAPIALTGDPTSKLIPGCRYLVYGGAPHGLFITHMTRFNADLSAFLET